MKVFFAVIASLIVMVGVYAVAAPASQHDVSAGLAKLEKKVKKLQRTVSKLKRTVTGIQRKLACESKVLPISEYGDSNGSFGYSFSNDGANFFLTSALDVTAQGGTVGAWIPVVKKSCVSSSRTGKLSAVQILPTQEH